MIETINARIIGEEIYIGDHNELIHNNHSIPTAEHEIREDSFTPYVVFEAGHGNFALIHGLLAENADTALQEIHSTLTEYDGEEPELTGVAKLKF